MIGPDATITLDFALNRLAGVIEKLLVYPENMRKNLDRLGGLHNSQRVLLALTQAGVSREDAYALVQRNAMKTWQHGKSFLAELEGRQGCDGEADAGAAEVDVRRRLSPEARRHDFRPRVRLEHFSPEWTPVWCRKCDKQPLSGALHLTLSGGNLLEHFPPK